MKNFIKKTWDSIFSVEKKANPYFRIVRKVLSEEVNLKSFDVYFIKSFENTTENFELFDSNFGKDSFYNAIEKLNYNSQADNLSIYYLLDGDIQGLVYLITDPVELYENPKVVKKYFGFLNDKVMSLETAELIHKN